MINDSVLINDWLPVAPASHLDKTGLLGARVLGEDIVIWRSGDQIFAWQDLCLHRGTKLSLGEVTDDGALMCPYHGWTYDAEGKCIQMPAHPEQTPSPRAVVKTYKATIHFDYVWVCFGEPQHEMPPFPEWEDETFRRIPCGPYEFKASAPRVVENFLDVAHFAFVHENSLGTREHPEIPDYDVVTDENGVIANNISVFQPNPDGTGVGKEVTYTYKVFRPMIAYFTKASEGPQMAIMLMVTPVDELHSLGWMQMLMNHSYDVPEVELRSFQDRVTAEDIPIVESQRPELLPLDLQAELHLRSDRTAIAYRKWLNELGLSFGTQ